MTKRKKTNNINIQNKYYTENLRSNNTNSTKNQRSRRVWRNQRGNQNPYIEEEQTTQWPKEKVQKDKQRSTKHTHNTKDRVTRIPLKTGSELRCSGRVNSSGSTADFLVFVLRNKTFKPECVGSFNMDWRILVFYPEPKARDKFTNIHQSMLKLKTHSG